MNTKTLYAVALATDLILKSTGPAQAAEVEQVLHIEPQLSSLVVQTPKGHPYLCKAKLLPPISTARQTTKPLTQDQKNALAALAEEAMQFTMKKTVPAYQWNTPLYTSESTAVEYGTTDNRVRIETRINCKTGTISADFTSEALTFGTHNGKATIATQATATAHTDNIFDPKATQLNLSAKRNEGHRAPNAEAQAATVMTLLDTFQTYMTDAKPMYMETRPEGFYEGKIKAGVIDAARIKNKFTTPPSP